MLPTRKSTKALVFQWSGGPWGQCPCRPLQSTPATASEPAPGRTQHTLSRSQSPSLDDPGYLPPPPSITPPGTGYHPSGHRPGSLPRSSPLRTRFKCASFWGPFPRTGPNLLVVLFSHQAIQNHPPIGCRFLGARRGALRVL